MALADSAAEATDQAELRLVLALTPPDSAVVSKSVAEAVTLITALDALSEAARASWGRTIVFLRRHLNGATP
jgi:hypothetical protein